jgi:hypothetical protein
LIIWTIGQGSLAPAVMPGKSIYALRKKNDRGHRPTE